MEDNKKIPSDGRKGYNTKARTAVTEFFLSNEGKTASASQIEKFLSQRRVEVSQSTVYRLLSRMEKDGELIKYVSEKGESAVYQYVGESDSCRGHLHLKCLSCGAVLHLDCAFMESLKAHLYSDHGFQLACDGSVIYGLCNACAK